MWSFKHLMENMAATPADAPAMVEAMLDTFTTQQTINGFTVDVRPGMQNTILAAWPRTSDGALDLAQAPLPDRAAVRVRGGHAVGLPHRHHDQRSGDRPAAHPERPAPPQRRPQAVVCTDPSQPIAPAQLRKGIQRVH